MPEIQYPTRIGILRNAVSLLYQHQVPDEFAKLDDAGIEAFYDQYRLVLAGPIQSAIDDIHPISDTKVDPPLYVQDLFMEAENTLAEAQKAAAAREEQFEASLEQFHSTTPPLKER